MDKPSWIDRINPFSRNKENSDIKSLQDQLDMAVGEYKDALDSEVKFLDAEPGGYNVNGDTDFTGIEQQLDISALQRVYATETWVYNAVTAIAETIAGLPIKLEKKTTVRKTVRNELTGQDDTISTVVWVDACGEKLYDRFIYPNKFTTKSEFYMLLVIDLLTAGDYYIYLDAKEGVDLTTIAEDHGDDNENSPFGRLRSQLAAEGTIRGMYRIPPMLIKPVLAEDKKSIAGYVMQTQDGTYAFSAAEIIHVKMPNPLDPVRGLAPLVPAFKPVLIDRFTTEHMIRFYKSGMRLGGIITTDKGLNKEQLNRFQRSLENNYTGRQNHHRTLILPPGMKYEAVEQNPAETSLLEFCKYNREAILSTYRVPPIKVGILDNANYANARAQLKTFFNDSIKPKMAFIEDGFNLKSVLLPDSRAYRFRFDLSEVEELKEDQKIQADTAKLMMDGGLTVNEVRNLVWKKQPIPEGDKSKVIEDFGKKPDVIPLQSSAPVGLEKGRNPEVTPATDIKPTKGTFTDRVRELVGQLVASGIPTDLAIPKAIEQARLEGFTDDQEAPAKDSEKLGTAENSALVPTAVGTGKPKAPCKVCGKMPCECPPDNGGKKEGKQTLAEFLAESLAKLDPSETVDPAFIQELVALYSQPIGEVEAKESGAAPTEQTVEVESAQAPVQTTSQLESFGFSKDKIVDHWKTFITKTEPMIGKRHSELQKFFKEFERTLLNRFGANIKSFGIHKARDSEDIDDITDLDAYDEVLKGFIKDIDAALLEAYTYGFNNTLTKFKFKTPNQEAIDFLEQYAADEVKYISETTRDQMREVLKDSFEKGQSVGETSAAIRSKFDEIEQGRAVTIARTETLAAVSAGREEKRGEWQDQFPDKKLRKGWVSSQDDRVRDSHDIDGEVVDADQEFSNGLKYPREQGGPPEEVINCRCDTIDFIEGDEELIQSALGNEDTGDEEKSFSEHLDKGGPGSGRHPTGRKPRAHHPRQPKGPKPSAKLSKDTQEIVRQRNPGEGAPVVYNKQQLEEILNNGTFALISAGKNPKNAEDMQMSDAQIKERYDKLAGDLKEAGYTYTTVEGHYAGKEDSFLVQVHSANKDHIVELGEKYNQDSVIYTSEKKNEMIFTTGADQGKSIKGEGWSWQDNADDFFTEVVHSDGTKSKFQLNFNFDAGAKGGPGSGRHPGFGKPKEPYKRNMRLVGPAKLDPAERTNHFDTGPYSDYSDSGQMMNDKGSEVTDASAGAFQRYASNEIAINVNPAFERAKSALEKEGIQISSTKIRAKSSDSLREKMNTKWSDKTLNQVTDGIGARMVLKDQKSADLAVTKLERVMGMKVLEHQDTTQEARGGYRSHNLLMRSPGGMIVEVQVKTENQDTWSRWSHDDIYKNPATRSDKNVQSYAVAVSNHLNALDMGKEPGERPVAPDSVKQAGLEFPWSKVKT